MQQQIFAELLSQIVDGLWIGRDDFPGEVELARQFGVSVITSRRVLERLAADGWIERGRGRRTAVRTPTASEPVGDPAKMRPYGQSFLPFAYEVLYRGIDIAPAEACRALGMAPGSKLWLCRRLRRLEGRAHSVTLSVQHPELGERHELAELQRLPIGQILRKWGFVLGTLTRRVSVRLPSSEVAAHLRITLTEPTLTYTFTLADDSATVLEWARICMHPREQAPREVMDLKTGRWVTDFTV